MTLYSMMEIYNRQHPSSGLVIRAPPFLPGAPTHHNGSTSPHPAHAFPLRIPIPLVAMQQHPSNNNNSIATQQQRQQPPSPSSPPEKPTSSFRIADILNGTIGGQKRKRVDRQPEIARPWGNFDASRSSRSSSPVEDENDEGLEEEIDVGEEKPKAQPGKNQKSPLDALFKMTSKTFEDLDGTGILAVDGENGENGVLFSKNAQNSKKRRKSRTAFTNQQIYELEKRFLYQKYLTPADRDEIAQQLGLSNAQVITWFQNRRAKLKRDLEELKADVTAAKVLGKESPSLITRLEEMQAYTTHHSFLKWDKKQLKVMSKYPPNFNPLPLPTSASDSMKHMRKPSTDSHSPNTPPPQVNSSNSHISPRFMDDNKVNNKGITSDNDDMEYSIDSEQEAAADRMAFEKHRHLPNMDSRKSAISGYHESSAGNTSPISGHLLSSAAGRRSPMSDATSEHSGCGNVISNVAIDYSVGDMVHRRNVDSSGRRPDSNEESLHGDREHLNSAHKEDIVDDARISPVSRSSRFDEDSDSESIDLTVADV